MHIRKLVKAGPSSHTIALPKEWINNNGLEKGNIVYITENPNKELTISLDIGKEKIEKKEIAIDTENKKLQTIQREVTSAYINNYSSIVLLGEGMDDKFESVKRIIQNFVAIEITEQTPKRVVIKDLLNLKEISVIKSIKRMDMILRSLFNDMVDTKENVQESIEFKDDDINRLYFLLVRILKSAMNNQHIATNLDISNNDILSMWYLTINLENIADNIQESFRTMSKAPPKESVTKIITEIKDQYLDVMKAFYNKDKSLADSVAEKRIETTKLIESFLENSTEPIDIEIANHTKQIINQINNISRIVIDHE